MLALARAVCFQPLHRWVAFVRQCKHWAGFVDRFTLDASGAVILFFFLFFVSLLATWQNKTCSALSQHQKL